MVFHWRRKKQVVVYSMDRGADRAIVSALKKTAGVNVRQVLTLDRTKIAKIMLAKDAVPRHLLMSERILRRDMAKKPPVYFVTIVPDGRTILGDPNTWFEEEFFPATGIDVRNQPFDHAETAREYQLGSHRLLLMSAHARRVQQQDILSGFLNKKVPPLSEKDSFYTAMHWHREGSIAKPLALLEEISPRKAPTESLYLKIKDQNRLLHEGYALPAKAQPQYTPAPRRIFYHAHQSLPFHASGYATRTQGIVKALRDKNWQVDVITRAGYPADTKAGPAPAEVYTHDSVAYNFDMRSGQGQFDLPLSDYIDHASAYLIERAKVMRPALIHSASNFMCGLAAIKAARLLGIPNIYEMRGLWHISREVKEPHFIDTEKHQLMEKMELEAARAADHVIAITGALKEWLVQHGIDAGKISLAPNAVDTVQFTPLPRDEIFSRETYCEGKIVIGYIGSFLAYEGLDLLLEAVVQLPEALRQKIRLLWVGAGPVLEPLLKQAESLGIRDLISALGPRPFADVPRAYSVVDICVFPRKSFKVCEIIGPLKPFEAMACGKAVLVSNVRPLLESVEDGVTGLVHVKGDSADLSRQLARLVNDESLRKSCGSNARQWVEETRNWNAITESVNAVYERMVA